MAASDAWPAISAPSPARSIASALQATEDEAGRRYPEFFRINFSRCIFCGYCEEACPTYAIQLTPDFEMGEYHRQNLVYEKEDLLIDGPGQISRTTISGASPAWRSKAKTRARPKTKRRRSTCIACALRRLMLFLFAAASPRGDTCLPSRARHAVHALLYLIVSLLAIAVIFYILGAPFIAALELIIYAGAIMVLFVFVVMMLNLGEASREMEREWLRPQVWIGPAILGIILFGEVFFLLAAAAPTTAAVERSARNRSPSRCLGLM